MRPNALASFLLCGGALLPLVARAQTSPFPPFAALAGGPSVFTKIGIRHYDAGVMADLATRPSGIIVVPPNFVIPAGTGPSSALAAPAVTTVGGPPVSPVVPAAFGGVPIAAPAGTNVLPDGVRRIFVLESDNSLVIEGTPDGAQALEGIIEGTAGH